MTVRVCSTIVLVRGRACTREGGRVHIVERHRHTLPSVKTHLVNRKKCSPRLNMPLGLAGYRKYMAAPTSAQIIVPNYDDFAYYSDVARLAEVESGDRIRDA